MVDVGAAPIDRYVVLEHLSEGGMGAIYLGKKLGAGGFEMEVVLKQLLPEFTQQEEFIELFLREARLSATLDHANIVHTIDLVRSGGEYFIVMEYLPGGDLRTLLKRAKRRGKRFSPAAAIHISREVLSALAYAHVKRGFDGNPLKLIHRDVSPSNILVSQTGEVKLTDFGIAKAATHNSLFYKVKGKIGYMSPEQARSEALDHRSDLYSLAVCMFEVLTGERLFVHAGLTTSADEIYSQPVPTLSRKVPGLPPDLDAVMNKALSLSPDARYQTASEFQEALTRCAHRNGLLISAPEVAQELLALCGPPDQWRGEDDDDDLGYLPRAGTEVYDGGDDDDEVEVSAGAVVHRISGGSGPLSAGVPMNGPVSGPVSRPSSARMSRPRTEMARLQGVVELTSIIKMIDLETQHREPLGARPLVDLDAGLGAGLRPAPRSGGKPAPAAPLQDPGTVKGRLSAPRRAATAPTDPRDLMPTDPRDLMPTDPRDLMPTDPRNFLPGDPRSAASTDPRGAMPTRPHPPSNRSQPRALPHFPASPAAGMQAAPHRRSALRPWMVIAAILLAAAIAAVIVAMSGPDVALQHAR